MTTIPIVEVGHIIAAESPDTMCQSADIARRLEQWSAKPKEHFMSVMLNTRNQVLAVEVVAVGTLSQCLTHPREVFRSAIALNAASVVVAHNHPSGNTEPSQNDIELTKRLVNAGEVIGIEVLDHLILSDGDYLSFKDMGMM